MGLNNEYIDLSGYGIAKTAQIVNYDACKCSIRDLFLSDDGELVGITVIDHILYNESIGLIFEVEFLDGIRNYYLVV